MCLTGLQDVEVFHYAEMEAVVGQDVTIPCTVKNGTNLQIVSIEWRKNRNENIKLALYNSRFGLRLFWKNVTVQIDKNSMGSSLHLHGVTKWNNDSYICDLTTFPFGSIRRQTELKIKGKMEENTWQSHNNITQPNAAVFTGFNIRMMCSNFLSNCPYISYCFWLHQSAAPLPVWSVIYFRANVWNNCKNTSAVKSSFAMRHLLSSL